MVIKQAGHQEGLVKAPKTIHRCILKTSVSTRSQVRSLLIIPTGLIFKCGGHFRQGSCFSSRQDPILLHSIYFNEVWCLCLWLQGRPRLSCHVCYASYQDYKTYFRHLINNSCVKQPTVDKSLLKSSLTIYAPSSAAEVRSFLISNWERERELEPVILRQPPCLW